MNVLRILAGAGIIIIIAIACWWADRNARRIVKAARPDPEIEDQFKYVHVCNWCGHESFHSYRQIGLHFCTLYCEISYEMTHAFEDRS